MVSPVPQWIRQTYLPRYLYSNELPRNAAQLIGY
jgi:hypothetical protein